MPIDAIILAAGRSSRFGGEHKLLSEIGGRALIQRVAFALAASRVRDIAIVTAPDTHAVIGGTLGNGRWRIVLNPNAAEGMASSLVAGLKSLPPDATGALVALGDMPQIDTALVDELTAAFDLCRGQAIVFPRSADGRQGHPVIWPSALFKDLMALTGDIGGKQVLQTNSHLWHPVLVTGTAAFADIDTREDLARACDDSG